MRFNPNINAAVISDIQQSEDNLQTAFQQVSTGLRVNSASDDPAASAALVQVQAQAANIDQYTANADSIIAQAQTADGVVSSVVQYLTQAITLGTEGANSDESTADKAAISAQVKGLLQSVVGLANTTYQGVSLFGGSYSGQAFTGDPTSGYTYQGNSDVNQVNVGDSLTVQVNIPGSTLFTSSSGNVIAALSGLATALTTGTTTDIGNATAAVTTALNYVTQQHAVYGNTINQLNSQETYLSQEKVTLTSRENSLVGIDPATAAEQLSQAETENSSVLAAAAKVIQNSLLNYLSPTS
jgi:flagellar hook-associated protein 3 FlgL